LPPRVIGIIIIIIIIIIILIIIIMSINPLARSHVMAQWLRAAADLEAVLLKTCNSTRSLLLKAASAMHQQRLPPVALPPRVLLTFMNWTSIDVSIRNLHALADQHGLLNVSRDHVVVLPRVAHADYMTRCGELHALAVACFTSS